MIESDEEFTCGFIRNSLGIINAKFFSEGQIRQPNANADVPSHRQGVDLFEDLSFL